MKLHRAAFPSVMITGLFLAAITGCQEPPMTSPAAGPEPSTTMKVKQQQKTEVLPLEGTLWIPDGSFNTQATISGSVVCSFTSTPQNGVYLLDLDLSTEAVLTLGGDEKGTSKVSGRSHELLSVSEEGIALLEKSYTLDGPMNRFRLRMRFLLTSDGIELNARWLEKTKGYETEGN